MSGCFDPTAQEQTCLTRGAQFSVPGPQSRPAGLCSEPMVFQLVSKDLKRTHHIFKLFFLWACSSRYGIQRPYDKDLGRSLPLLYQPLQLSHAGHFWTICYWLDMALLASHCGIVFELPSYYCAADVLLLTCS